MGNKRKYSVPKPFASSRPENARKRVHLDKQQKQDPHADIVETFSDDEGRPLDIMSDDDAGLEKLSKISPEDDEEIDEDEAFDDNDEEKWGEFFAASVSNKRSANDDEADLLNENSEGSGEEEPSDFEDDEDAVDITEMFDDDKLGKDLSLSGDEEEYVSSGEEEPSESDSDSDVDLSTIVKATAPVKQKSAEEVAKNVKVEAYEEGEFNYNRNGELTLDTLFDDDSLDPSITEGLTTLRRQIQRVNKDAKKVKVAVPLPLTTQNRLDRETAYTESSSKVAQWMPMVQKNRQADQISFPLNKPGSEKMSTAALASRMKPMTGMEAEISNLLDTAGIATEKQIMKAEELAMNKLDPEQVKAQRIELQKMRALLFYAEQKQKKAAKIKSKKYRRIKKKEKERLASKLAGADGDGVAEMDDEDRLDAERKRAEERMTLRHKSGNRKNQFDFKEQNAESRAAIIEKLDRHELLMKKISGQDGSDSDADDNDNDEQDDEKLQSLIKDIKNQDTTGKPNGVFAMRFMQKAMDAKKNAAIEEIEGMFTSAAGDSDDENAAGVKIGNNPGRLVFGEHAAAAQRPARKIVSARHSDHEVDLDEEDGAEDWLGIDENRIRPRKGTSEIPARAAKSDHARAQKLGKKLQVQMEKADKAIADKSSEFASPANAKAALFIGQEREISFESQKELIELAFADDDVIREFEAEKSELVGEEAPQSVDVTLPGWGNWSDQPRKKPVLKQKAGVQPDARKDYRLKHVIINEKTDKKFVEKYQVNKLPYPYKGKAAFEAMNRAPIGKEWNASGGHAKLTQRRIVAEPGLVIAPPKFVKQPKDSRKRPTVSTKK